ncbi:MAG: HAMP domain-containing histidine kinase [Clostridiales bacterium]|nr:HAMP domain-containing histidine kinase [Clostridiales bacterium]
MNNLQFFIIALAAALAAALLAVMILYIRQKKQIDFLTKQTRRFIDNNEIVQYSLMENGLAQLQNNIADIENTVLREKHNTAEQLKKNSRFIADISHQLKTPIAALKLFLELDSGATAPAHIDKELQLIEKTEQLIAQVLLLEKIKTNIYEMNFEKISAESFIEPIALQFSAMYGEKQITYKANGDFRCDREWLAQAVSNIVKNACEHTGENGRVEIEVDCRENSTCIEIQDNGGGAAEKDLQNMFERFFKAENSKPGNAGIGLAIAKEIVEKHHGGITAQNKNNGLLVSITIPKIDGYIAI